MSNAILEAMAHSLPVIASRVGGCSELLDEGRAGVLFEARDAKALAREMSSLAESPSLRVRLGAAAADRARSRFSLERMVEETLRGYAAACSNDAPAAEYFSSRANALAQRSGSFALEAR